MSDTAVGREVRWEDLQQGHSLAFDLLVYCGLSAGFMLLAWGVHALVTWQDALRWPVVIGVLMFDALLVLAVVTIIRAEVKRRDTGTQSIRSASQGRIELVGMVQAVGEPMISPLYGVPCVAYRSSFEAFKPETAPVGDAGKGKAAADPLSFFEEMAAPAFLLTDGIREVFVPLEAFHLSGVEIVLNKDDEPLDTLRPDVAERLLPDMTITNRDEDVVPIGKLVMANGVFRTFSSGDSYTRAAARHRGIEEPSDEALAGDPVETRWRAHCRRKEAAAGSSPVRVDALLPVSHFLGLPVVRANEPSWREAVKQTAMMLVVLVPGLYLAVRLLDVMSPLPLLF